MKKKGGRARSQQVPVTSFSNALPGPKINQYALDRTLKATHIFFDKLLQIDVPKMKDKEMNITIRQVGETKDSRFKIQQDPSLPVSWKDEQEIIACTIKRR